MTYYWKAWIVVAATFCLPPGMAAAQPSNPPRVSPSAASPPADAEVLGYDASFPALGTLVQLKAFSADPATVKVAFNAAEQLVRELESILSDYDSESETRRLTERAFHQPTAVSDDLWRVLAASDRWHQQSDGAFDASLGNLTRLWRQSRRGAVPPTASAIAQALDRCGWRHIRLHPEPRAVELLSEGVAFDFGAIGKGYIVDRLFDSLVAHGLEKCLVNISGNMRCGPAPPDREGWRIALSPLEKDGPPLREISVSHCAIATSGDLWQFSIIDGVRRSHILDPKTGKGVPGPLAATAIADNATDADAMATIGCILNTDAALALAAQHPSMHLLIARHPSSAEFDATTVKVVESPAFPTAIAP